MPRRPRSQAPLLRAATGCLLACLLATGASAQRAYYFSPDGDDASGNGTRAQPWASIAQANTLDLGPGDSLRFEGGALFVGGLYLDAVDAGAADRPVVIDTYGSGRATINAGDGFGIFVYNAGGIEVRDLVVTGSGVGSNESDGIGFYLDLPGGVERSHVRIVNVEVSGFGKNGLSLGAWNGRSGWRDVWVTDSDFNGNANGMQTFAEEKGAIKEVYVGRCRFFDNPGRGGLGRPSGSGLVLGGVDGAVVERSLAYGNGAANTNPAGPVGIWAYDANDVVIQHNESYANRTGVRSGGGDGGGFDLDGGVTNSTLQYNYSHDNDGAGFGLFQYAGAAPSGGNVVRFNISENDGRANGYGGISIWGASPDDPVGAAEVYHNTVYISPAPHQSPAAVEIKNQHHDDIAFRNNVLVSTAGVRLVRGPASASARFEGNAYWGGEAFSIKWGNTYESLDGWRTATAQEQLPAALGGGATGLASDPLLNAPGAGGTVGDATRLETLEAYGTRPGSPLLGAGLDLEALFEIDPGPHDFFGMPVGGDVPFGMGSHQPDPVPATRISGGIVSIDVAAEALHVDGVRVAVTPATTMRDGVGNPLAFHDLYPGLFVEVEGNAAGTDEIEAYRVVAAGGATDTEGEDAFAVGFEVSSVFPNPAMTHATLLLDLSARAELEVSVYDLLGREVRHLPGSWAGAGRAVRIEVRLEGLARGIYIVRVTALGIRDDWTETIPLTVLG